MDHKTERLRNFESMRGQEQLDKLLQFAFYILALSVAFEANFVIQIIQSKKTIP